MKNSVKKRFHLEKLFFLSGISDKWKKNGFSLARIAVSTQPARDVSGTSPEGPNVRDLQGTFRGLLGDQQKNW